MSVIFLCMNLIRSWHSTVVVLTDYWKGDQSSISRRNRNAYIRHPCILTMEPTQPFPVDADNSLTDDAAVGAITDHSLLSNSYAKNMWLRAISPPYIFLDVVKYKI